MVVSEVVTHTPHSLSADGICHRAGVVDTFRNNREIKGWTSRGRSRVCAVQKRQVARTKKNLKVVTLFKNGQCGLIAPAVGFFLPLRNPLTAKKQKIKSVSVNIFPHFVLVKIL